jgi:hypothetical protein
VPPASKTPRESGHSVVVLSCINPDEKLEMSTNWVALL